MSGVYNLEFSLLTGQLCSYRLTLEDRIATLESKSEAIQRNSAFGAKEMTFIPSSVSNSLDTTHTI